jgi:hypothetical protein
MAACNLQRPPDILQGGFGNRADQLARVRVANLDDPVAGDFLAGDAHRFVNHVALGV